MKRILNEKPEWNVEPTSKGFNFYPVDSAIAIKDMNKNYQMTVMNCRP